MTVVWYTRTQEVDEPADPSPGGNQFNAASVTNGS